MYLLKSHWLSCSTLLYYRMLSLIHTMLKYVQSHLMSKKYAITSHPANCKSMCHLPINQYHRKKLAPRFFVCVGLAVYNISAKKFQERRCKSQLHAKWRKLGIYLGRVHSAQKWKKWLNIIFQNLDRVLYPTQTLQIVYS